MGGLGDLGVLRAQVQRASAAASSTSIAWGEGRKPYARLGEVDTVDGFVMCLSPWVVRNLRFDESLGLLHGYDFDFCLQVREAGKKVVTADFKAIHHHSLVLISNPETWVQAHMAIAEKWEGRMPGVGVEGGDWKQRARRAEAMAAAARAEVVSIELQSSAKVNWHLRDLTEAIESVSWRLTKPLRAANQARRNRAARRTQSSVL